MPSFDVPYFTTSTMGWLRRHENRISAVSLAGGFAFDSWAFGRIDRPETQAVFITYLLVAAITIVVLHVQESRPEGKRPSERVRAGLMLVTQFALGCLLSGFCVFYIRSASLLSSWPFLMAMVGIFIANEYMRRYHSRLVFVALLFFLSLYSYAILLVPLLVQRIGRVPFLLNAAYFLKVLPPLPLVLTDAGVYHSVERVDDGYLVGSEQEPPEWEALFGTYPIMHIQPWGKIYIYNSVFAPRGLQTIIVHNWQRRDPDTGAWVSKQQVQVNMVGGRAGGYRWYTYKTAPQPGQWRVNIETQDGRRIGRVRFAVEDQAVPPAVTKKLLK